MPKLDLQPHVGVVSKLIKGLTDNQHLKLMHARDRQEPLPCMAGVTGNLNAATNSAATRRGSGNILGIDQSEVQSRDNFSLP